ncbi:MAG: glycosyltransferase [Saprospiraceae bacterium]
MKVLHVFCSASIPTDPYHGPERMMWTLGKGQSQLGAHVSFLVQKGSRCPFGQVIEFNPRKALGEQIPPDIDVAHFHDAPPSAGAIEQPWLYSLHHNAFEGAVLPPNTVFATRNHALRHGGEYFVYYGIDPDDYMHPDPESPRSYFHFLSLAGWQMRNLKGAIQLADSVGERLHVIGGKRISFKEGLRITLSPHVRFHGLLSLHGRNAVIERSKGLIFPVLWHKPFALTVVESLCFGCPIFATPFGSIPEILGFTDTWESGCVETPFGVLSDRFDDLQRGLKQAEDFNRRYCQEYVFETFGFKRFARQYLDLYEKIRKGQMLHANSIYPHELETHQSLSLK